MNAALPDSAITREESGSGAAFNFSSEKIKKFFCLLTVCLGAFQTFAYWESLNPDAACYLETGKEWWSAQPLDAVNGYWNPLFPVWIGWTEMVFPSRENSIRVAHLMQFPVILVLIALFHSLLARSRPADGTAEESRDLLTVLLLYPTFAWSSLYLLEISFLTPDLWVAVAILGAARYSLDLEEENVPLRRLLPVPFFLALGYWAKTAMFILGVCFLALLALRMTPAGRAFRRGGFMMLFFFLLCLPHILLLSKSKGRWTAGESGPLAYAWVVNQTSPYVHWQGHQAKTGVPAHPTRVLSLEPEVYEFERVNGGTYPPWNDPSYWNEGLRPYFDLKAQIKTVFGAGAFYAKNLLLRPLGILWLVVGLGLLLLHPRTTLSRWASEWPLLAWSFAAFSMYALVYVESRYLAAFCLLIPWVVLKPVYSHASLLSRADFRWLTAVGLLIAILGFAFVAAYSLRPFRNNDSERIGYHRLVTRFLAENGLQPGDKIAIMGNGFRAYYAYLARLKIVAEAPTYGRIPSWLTDLEARKAATNALFTTPAKAIVLDTIPSDLNTNEWQRIPGTSHAVLWRTPLKSDPE